MATSTAQKLRIKEHFCLYTLHAPSNYIAEVGPLPMGVQMTNNANLANQIHWFVSNKAQLDKELPKVLKMLKPNMIVWVYFPKATSKLQTDLSRDKGWDSIIAQGDKLTWLSLISFNDTWSVFGLRPKNETDKKKEAKPIAEKEIVKWVNTSTKEVRLPADMAAALELNKSLYTFFQSLAYSHRKEYVEWVVDAKKEETRKRRIAGTIERLAKGWKNPANNT